MLLYALDPTEMAVCLTCIDFWSDLKGCGVLTVLSWWWMDTQRSESESWSTALIPLLPLENALHATCHRLRANALWYDVSSTGPSLFPCHSYSFLSLCVYMSVCTSFHSIVCHVTQGPADSSSYSPDLLLLYSFLIFNLALCFQREALTFVLLCNEQMPAVNVFLVVVSVGSLPNTEQEGGHLHLIIL